MCRHTKTEHYTVQQLCVTVRLNGWFVNNMKIENIKTPISFSQIEVFIGFVDNLLVSPHSGPSLLLQINIEETTYFYTVCDDER